jgi:hypothetical protein
MPHSIGSSILDSVSSMVQVCDSASVYKDTYTDMWFDTGECQRAPRRHYGYCIPVMSPLSRLPTSSRSSSSFKKSSIPCVSTRLKPDKKPLHSSPTAPMVKADAARHGALGASGCSSGRIESGMSCCETCRRKFSHALPMTSPGTGGL